MAIEVNGPRGRETVHQPEPPKATADASTGILTTASQLHSRVDFDWAKEKEENDPPAPRGGHVVVSKCNTKNNVEILNLRIISE